MPTATDHPTDAELSAYIQGRLPPDRAARLDAHVDGCDRCCGRLGRLAPGPAESWLRELAADTAVHPATPAPALDLHDHPRYEVRHQLGRGGMGVVYLARHRVMHRDVALKVIRPDRLGSPELVDRFRREVRAAAQLSHPNVVTAFDAEEAAGVHFLVMEYIPGKTLDAVVRDAGPLPVVTACRYAKQAAEGLAYAHAAGMVHRDVKPHNLILADGGAVKVLDFGLARWRPADAAPADPGTREGMALGTMAYAAPEQLSRADTADARADQYGLGATLLFLLTGGPPGAHPDRRAALPDGLRAVLDRLLARNPEDRYPTTADAVAALAPWCRPPAVVKAKRRPPRWLPAAAVLVFAGLVGFGVWIGTPPRRPDPTAPAVPPPSAPDRGWRSLLTFDPAAHAVAGEWRRADGGLHVAAAQGARLAVPGAVPAEYDLRCVFTRHTGTQSVGVVVVQNGRQVVFELDAWNQHLGGFQDIAGRTLRDNPTRRDGMQLTNGRRYTIVVEVRRDRLRGLLDGREIATHRTDGSDLAVNPQAWPMPPGSGLGLVAWQSGVTFHALELAGR